MGSPAPTLPGPTGPAFVVGVVGSTNVDPTCREAAVAAVGRVFRWIAASHDEVFEGLNNGLGLRNTPLLLLAPSSMDGSCQWALDEALRSGHPAGIRQIRVGSVAAGCEGEYLAAYSDLLLAIRGPAQSSADPASVIESKRRGVAPDALPGVRLLDGSDNGPVVCIDTQSRVAGQAGRETGTARLAVLHPYDCRPPDAPDAPDDDPRWQARGWQRLRAVADNLERFNAEPPGAWAGAADASFSKMLPLAAGTDRAEAPALWATLERVFRLRSRASALNHFYEKRTMRLARRLVGLALVSALALTLSDYWLPQALAPADPNAVPWHRTVLFAASVLALGFTRLIYQRFSRTSGDERRSDYRALAEGARVQFYWTAAGTGASVASSYLQRQLGEVNWVRCAVSAESFPYEHARAAFGGLDLSRQIELLRAVHVGWIRGQASWFESTLASISRRQTVLADLSFTLLWAGFVLNLVYFAAQVGGLTQWLLAAAGSLAVAGAVLLGGQWMLSRRDRPRPGFWQSFFPARFGSVANRSVVIAAIVALGLGASYALGERTAQIPSALKLLGIVKNLLVTAGVLCSTWSSVIFLDENIRRYTAIGALFRSADLRVHERLAQAEEIVGGGGDDDTERRRIVAEVQMLLVDLGREALADNTDWLLMRRDHPLRPISV